VNVDVIDVIVNADVIVNVDVDGVGIVNGRF